MNTGLVITRYECIGHFQETGDAPGGPIMRSCKKHRHTSAPQNAQRKQIRTAHLNSKLWADHI